MKVISSNICLLYCCKLLKSCVATPWAVGDFLRTAVFNWSFLCQFNGLTEGNYSNISLDAQCLKTHICLYILEVSYFSLALCLRLYMPHCSGKWACKGCIQKHCMCLPLVVNIRWITSCVWLQLNHPDSMQLHQRHVFPDCERDCARLELDVYSDPLNC